MSFFSSTVFRPEENYARLQKNLAFLARSLGVSELTTQLNKEETIVPPSKRIVILDYRVLFYETKNKFSHRASSCNSDTYTWVHELD